MLNQVTLIGRLTGDPELKYTPSGVAKVDFTIAVDRSYATNGEKETDFIRCTAWKGVAETLSNYYSKGNLIGLIGEVRVHSWADPETGKKRSITYVHVNKSIKLEKKPKTISVKEKEETVSEDEAYDPFAEE